MKPVRNGKIWDLEDEYFLYSSILRGLSLSEIADKLQRSEKACAVRAHQKIMPKSRNNKHIISSFLKDVPNEVYDFETNEHFKAKAIAKKFYK